MSIKKSKKRNPTKLLLILIIIAITSIICYQKFISKEFNYQSYKRYLASQTTEVILYELDEDNNLNPALSLTRGEEITTKLEEVEISSKKYITISYQNKKYYVLKENLSETQEDVVLEKELYVRTTCSILSSLEDPQIIGLAEKGNQVTILGYEGIENGQVTAYKISTTGSTGYVYGKYLVKTSEEAVKNYNAEINDPIHQNVKNLYGGGEAIKLDYYPVEKGNFEDNLMPEAVYALYLNASASTINNIDNYIAFAKETQINTFVIDILDNGSVGYPSTVMQELSPTTYQNAANSFETYQNAINKIKQAGFYVVGRITVFKDDYYVKDHPEDAISSLTDETPYLHQSSYWPSAYSRNVWYYKVKLAKQAVIDMGFNEINFDYTRFPDLIRNKENILDMKNTYQEDKVEAIQRFLMYACDELHKQKVYISVDVFGESVTNNYTTAYGQYWPAISNIVDVISGMPYPDHFANYSYGIEKPWNHPYELMKAWGKYAYARQEETTSPAIVRTWIQAYDVLKRVDLNGITYGASELESQIRGLYESNLIGGYITWLSNSNIEKYKTQKNAFSIDYWKEYTQ